MDARLIVTYLYPNFSRVITIKITINPLSDYGKTAYILPPKNQSVFTRTLK